MHQRFFGPDYAKLGPEIHAASYTLKLGGRCRLHGSERWLSLDQGKKLTDLLPQTRVDNIKVEGLDFSKSVIQIDGLSNIGLN